MVTGLVLWRLADHDLDRRKSESFDFAAAGQFIAGTLWLPDDAPHAAVVLVHGDGAQDRTAAGGYAPLINSFLDGGIAVAAWDKPGVGSSSGNWLHNSMADRTAISRAALLRLGRRFDGIGLGAVGFSQAGWALPRLTQKDADFIVLIGAAVSWQDQGDYFARRRLAREGLSPRDIERTIELQHRSEARAFGANAQAADIPEGMSPDRWGFVRRNRGADAREALSRLDLPLLAIWGAEDLNVDADRNASIYRELVAQSDTGRRIIVWPDATHGLLKAAAYNWQLTDDWSWFAKLRFVAEGRYAFAPGALDVVMNWMRDQRHDSIENP
ncbi:hypothetical protein SAMN05444007_11068 [Cribrihabitans marinus]|uniref:Serine aminopeptidase S33 domain-containing protein n=2 Tax=Cribrihabitans marinus TaxID=1227549 RepID=A0A1H7DIL1_9RHOB|nr:hypothetical protein GCM10010973_33080 [Cribrihabitans marinus]SEJ98065.1 hypothetical protein SAMN05444007_11068 [Cribrihabitans marinus]